jgi:pimeloyl-ACP methyl ester carboxylesterase
VLRWLSILFLLTRVPYAVAEGPQIKIEGRRIETSSIPIKYYAGFGASRKNPTLVFLGGFYPLEDLKGYEKLFVELAGQGISVVAPMYIVDENDWIGSRISAYRAIEKNGYSSKDYARGVETALRDFQTKIPTDRWVLYGHSMGARVAAALLEENHLRFEGVLLDGVPGQKEFNDADRLIIDDESPIQTPHEWPPTTVIHYEKDSIFTETTRLAYLNAPARTKELIQICVYPDPQGRKSPADHFSSFTDDTYETTFLWIGPPFFIGVSVPSLKSWIRRTFVDPEAKRIHGYSPRFTMNRIDEYGLLALLPALVRAYGPNQDGERERARETLYGSLGCFIADGDTLRKILQTQGLGH